MHNETFKKIALFFVSTTLILVLFGCSNSANNSSNNTSNQLKKAVQQPKKDPIGKPVDLGAGTFTAPQDIKPGVYDLTLVGQSNGRISAVTNNTDQTLSFTEDSLDNVTIDGKDDMHSIVDKMRIKVIDGTKLTINDINKIHFEPVTSQPQLSDTVINEGRYENFKPGRYTITALYGNGAVYIFNKQGIQQQQQILSDGTTGNDPKTATIDIKNGDIIFVSDLRQVQLKHIGD